MPLHKEPCLDLQENADWHRQIRNGSRCRRRSYVRIRIRSHICRQADLAEASGKAEWALSLSLWLVQQAGEAWAVSPAVGLH